ncbi:DUF1801 domain-containing protein [Novipirellula sp. SH528]|uniref:YdeI/OmpD-associated family protein n=1 Tax=Novipirellula sp. SH528 TaxID=3454466 RepID=UPI003F9EE377
MKKSRIVDEYIRKNKKWQEELQALRTIVLDCQLTEEVKWRVPCYTFQGKNVLLVSSLKEYCALSFVKGALLKDTDNILCQPGENTRAARLIRFTNVGEIVDLEPVLKSYVHEAIELEKAGVKVDFQENRALEIPGELQAKFDERPAFKTALDALTPGRQRGYVLHFSSAKQSKTRVSRIESCVQKILDGKGINDCTCGLSKKMPGCDGSHKSIR